MTGINVHAWGFKNKTQWVLIEVAPLTDSGLNEILFAAPSKKKLVEIAKLFDLKVSGYNAYYEIIRLDSIEKKAEEKK